MIIIKTRTLIIDVDLEEERNRIRRLFKQKLYQKALIKVIDDFEKYGYSKACDAYDALPYNKKDEYPLQESMGKWWWQMHGSFEYEKNVIDQTKLEIIKTEE